MLQPGPNALAHTLAGMAKAADFFLRPPTLTANNFAALWLTDPKFSAFKDLNLFFKVYWISRCWQHFKGSFCPVKVTSFFRVYLVTICKQSLMAIYCSNKTEQFWKDFQSSRMRIGWRHLLNALEVLQTYNIYARFLKVLPDIARLCWQLLDLIELPM